MINTTIRVSTLSDLDAIAALDSEVFGVHSYSLLVFRQMMDIGHICFVAEGTGGEIVGYTLGALGVEKNKGWILALAVKKAYRCQGIASKLTTKVIDAFAAQQVECVLLTVDPNNKAAINLYQKIGFFDTRRETDYFGPGEDRIVMEKQLKEA
jgi:ribosomal protein S18 acetylase RimI-like enzyme